MSTESSWGPTSRLRRRELAAGPIGRVARWATKASAITWAVALLAAGVDLLVRPPCPDGYVRLIDVVPTVPVVAGIGMAVGALAFLGARRPGRHPLLATFGCISLALSVLLVLAVGAAIFSNLGAQYDNSCWTF